MSILSEFRCRRPLIPLALVFAFVSSAGLSAAEPADPGAMSSGMMMEHCKEMQIQKAHLKADRKVQDADLATLIAKARGSAEDQKVSLLTDVVTLMFDQRKVMDARTAKMEDDMMAHMMQHVHMGKASMDACPMMKAPNMEGMVEKDVDHGNLKK